MKYKLRGNLPKQSNDYAADVLMARGIADPYRYKRPTVADLHDYMLLDRVEEGATLLAGHIAKGSKIFQVVDSDADGYSSGAIFYNYVKKMSPETNIEFYVHTGKQHGVLVDIVPADCKLVVIIDAGSNQSEEFADLHAQGHDVLCIDHHHTDNPPTTGVLINNQLGNYPNKSLSGAGVLYKFLQCYDDMYGNEGDVDEYLDLVALSLISDMMDLRDYENRYLVSRGLKQIKNLGLSALIEKQAYSIGDTMNLTPEKISFYVAPLINAIVRFGTQKEKETMFLGFVDGARRLPSEKRGAKEGDFETAAGQTARVATNVRARQNKAKDQAIGMMNQKVNKYNLDSHKVILITLDDEESRYVDGTLTGLIAMQMTKIYQRPILITRSDRDGEYFSGSGRGINESELDDFRKFCEDSGLVNYAQGHASAFGFSIHRDNRDAFLTYADKKLKDIDFSESFYDVDYELGEKDDIARIIYDLGSASNMWGQGVTVPLVVIKDAQLFAKDIKRMGKNGEHVKFRIGGANGVDCVKFFATDFLEQVGNGQSFKVTLLGKANINHWMGQIIPQFMIEDYELEANDSAF